MSYRGGDHSEVRPEAMSSKAEPEIFVPGVPATSGSTNQQMVTVVAPSTLAEGYTFTAQVEGDNFTVTVPSGGVTEGQPFLVPYPTDAAGVSSTPIPGGPKEDVLGAPNGRWRVGLCDCCEVLCDGLFWMALCFPPFLYGQLSQRMRYNLCGMPGGNSSTCHVITITFAIYYGLWFIGFSVFLWPIVFVYLIILGMNVRYNFRKRYQIEPSCCHCCDGMLDDCMCATCCECCAGVQMARHTHDEKTYGYMCCTETGLSTHAPHIV